MNQLGRALRYLTEAWAYASEPFKARKEPPQQLMDILRTTQFATGGNEANVDYFLLLAATNPIFFGNVSTIANRIAGEEALMVQVRQGEEWVDEPNHEFMELLAVPNALFPGSLLLEDLTWWYHFLGNGYWYFASDTPGRGPIREIWPLPARNVEPDPTTYRISPITKSPVIDYVYTLGQRIVLPGENVLHVRGANVFSYWEGLSPLSALQAVLDTDHSEAKWLGSFFKEGNAIPTAVISMPPNVPDNLFDKIKQDIIEQFGARRRAAITRAGDLDVKLVQHSIQEMRVVEGMDHNEGRINRVTHYPSGLMEATSGQSRLAADMALMRDAVQPFLNRVAAFLTLKAAIFYGPDVCVVARNVVPQDRALKVAEFRAYTPYRTINQSRGDMGEDPIKLKGPLAVLQPLLDEVPERLLQTATQLLLDAQKPAPPSSSEKPVITDTDMPGSRTTGVDLREEALGNLINGKAATLPLSEHELEAALYSALVHRNGKHG